MAFHVRGQDFLNELPGISQDLPVSPRLFKMLFSLTSEHSSFSLTDVAKAIEKDQGLTVRILAMANSAYYGLQSQVGSVHRAVMVLGLKEVRKLFLLLNIRSLERRLDPDGFDVALHWRHQIGVAQAARILARHVPSVDPDELYTIGLLHDLGKMITAIYRPQDWRAIRKLREIRDIPLFLAEDAYWGLDHALIGALTLKSWFLPASLTEPINWHHAPELAEGHTMQARIIRLADLLVRTLLEGQTMQEDHVPEDIRDLRLPEDLRLALIPQIEAARDADAILLSLDI